MVNDIWSWVETHQQILEVMAVASFIGFAVMILLFPIIAIWLPSDYLTKAAPAELSLLGVIRKPYLILKNLFGGLLVLAGLAMLVLPGQGLFTLGIGLSFLNIPGKRRLIRRVIGHPKMLHAINSLRKKAGKAPLEISHPDHP